MLSMAQHAVHHARPSLCTFTSGHDLHKVTQHQRMHAAEQLHLCISQPLVGHAMGAHEVQLTHQPRRGRVLDAFPVQLLARGLTFRLGFSQPLHGRLELQARALQLLLQQARNTAVWPRQNTCSLCDCLDSACNNGRI